MPSNLTDTTNGTNKNIRNAVIYVRVSTEEQARTGTSLDTQREVCSRLAAQMKLAVVEICADEGVSGTRYTSRPGMQRALNLIETGQASVLIAAKLDRIGRKTQVILDIAQRVLKADAELIADTYHFANTLIGQLTLTMFAGIAQFEHGSICERTQSGKRKRAEEGQQPQRSTPAYGYHIVTNAQVECGQYPPSMRGRYVIVEEQAEIVRELFTRYAAGGVGFPPLARDLNARRVPASRGGLWHPVCVSIILRNPVYKGEPSYGRTSRTLSEAGLDDRHRLTGVPLIRPRAVEKPGQPVMLTAPLIVSEELWNQVQARITTNQTQQGGNPRRARMLSGRAFCPCGHNAALVGKPGAKYYQCTKTRFGKFLHGENACQTTCYAVKMIEQSVIVSLMDASAHPESLDAAVKIYQVQQIAECDTRDLPSLRRERTALNAALTQLEQNEAIAIQAQMAGIGAGASPNAYAAVFADIAAKRKDLEDRRGVVSRLLTMPEKNGNQRAQQNAPCLVRQALEDLAHVLSSDALPGQEKRDLVGSIIDRVVCQPEGADVFFLPGLGIAQFQASLEGAETCNSTLTELIQ